MAEGTDERHCTFKLCLQAMRGNYKGNPNKKDRFTLFINDRLLESTAIKRCVDEVYSNRPDHVASTTSKPFAYLSLKVPGSWGVNGTLLRRKYIFVRGRTMPSVATGFGAVSSEARRHPYTTQLSISHLDGNHRHSRSCPALQTRRGARSTRNRSPPRSGRRTHSPRSGRKR